jgi:NADH:ubiquinone oxidoreductase subunit F (NADH-binding)
VIAGVRVAQGPWLLQAASPDLARHRALRGPVPAFDVDSLLELLDRAALRGRGGAAFPFARKLRATARSSGRRRHVVVNLSEGEPASFKDLALAVHQPHLVLDGATVVAAALGVREVHLVLPAEQPEVGRAVARALVERRDEDRAVRRRWRTHTASPRFVAGEASAVIELIEGRDNLPVTSWHPTAVSGVRGAPTLLSNAETYAQVAAFVLGGTADPGTPEEPGTRLLSIGEPSGGARVVEVAHGTPWQQVLAPAELAGAVLIGGYHGTWASAGGLSALTVSHEDLAGAGLSLGAGVVLPLATGACPLRFTGAVVGYLAGQSAGRCGPCRHGLPALAAAFHAFLAGGRVEPVERLVGLVAGRGACAHPDGTSRLVRSALTAFTAEVAAHASGGCAAGADRALVGVGPR